MPPQLNLFVIRARDPASLAAFYVDIGFSFALERHGSGPMHYASQGGAFVFEIYPAGASGVSTASVRMGFRVMSIADVLERLGEAADILSPPAVSEWGMRCVVKDPEGHKVELTEG